MNRIKDYVDARYRVEFKDKRVVWMRLSAKEIMFLHNHMFELNIGRWEIDGDKPVNIFSSGGDNNYCIKNHRG